MSKIALTLTTAIGLALGSVGHSLINGDSAVAPTSPAIEQPVALPMTLEMPTIIQPDRYIGHPGRIDDWIATYFQPWEFASKGNGLVDIEARLVNTLDAVRAEFGQPIRITSGYRNPDHNRRVGGATNSQHMHGMATLEGELASVIRTEGILAM